MNSGRYRCLYGENGWKRVGQVESAVGQEGVGRW